MQERGHRVDHPRSIYEPLRKQYDAIQDTAKGKRRNHLPDFDDWVDRLITAHISLPAEIALEKATQSLETLKRNITNPRRPFQRPVKAIAEKRACNG